MTEKTYIMITETGNAYKVMFNKGIGGTIGILDKKSRCYVYDYRIRWSRDN